MTCLNKNGIMPELVPLLRLHLHKNRAMVVFQKPSSISSLRIQQALLNLILEKSLEMTISFTKL